MKMFLLCLVATVALLAATSATLAKDSVPNKEAPDQSSHHAPRYEHERHSQHKAVDSEKSVTRTRSVHRDVRVETKSDVAIDVRVRRPLHRAAHVVGAACTHRHCGCR